MDTTLVPGRHTQRAAAWVDDLAFAHDVPTHAACKGLDGGCAICSAELPIFKSSMTYWYWLANQLGLDLALHKRQEPGQKVNYVGLAIDTVAGKVAMMPGKYSKLCRLLLGVIEKNTASSKELDGIRARSWHYAQAIRGTRVLATSISAALGTDDKPSYDTRVVISSELRADLQELLDMTKRNVAAGSFLWPPSAASVYAKLCRGDQQDDGNRMRPIFSLTVRNDRRGWAASLRVGNRSAPFSILEGPPVWQQGLTPAESCGAAAVLALEAATASKNLLGYIGVIRVFEAETQEALAKGTRHSKPLQERAVAFNRLTVESDILPKHLLVAKPGDKGWHGQLAQPVMDDSDQGPFCTPAMHQLVDDFACSLRLLISCDMFASRIHTHNSRYYSRYYEVDNECTDAFTAQDWDRGRCGACWQRHRQTGFYMPPFGLFNAAVKRASDDGARGIWLVAEALTAPGYGALMRSRLADPVRIKDQRVMLVGWGSLEPTQMVLIAADFRSGPQPSDAGVTPACAGWPVRSSFASEARIQDAADWDSLGTLLTLSEAAAEAPHDTSDWDTLSSEPVAGECTAHGEGGLEAAGDPSGGPDSLGSGAGCAREMELCSVADNYQSCCIREDRGDAGAISTELDVGHLASNGVGAQRWSLEGGHGRLGGKPGWGPVPRGYGGGLHSKCGANGSRTSDTGQRLAELEGCSDLGGGAEMPGQGTAHEPRDTAGPGMGGAGGGLLVIGGRRDYRLDPGETSLLPAEPAPGGSRGLHALHEDAGPVPGKAGGAAVPCTQGRRGSDAAQEGAHLGRMEGSLGSGDCHIVLPEAVGGGSGASLRLCDRIRQSFGLPRLEGNSGPQCAPQEERPGAAWTLAQVGPLAGPGPRCSIPDAVLDAKGRPWGEGRVHKGEGSSGVLPSVSTTVPAQRASFGLQVPRQPEPLAVSLLGNGGKGPQERGHGHEVLLGQERQDGGLVYGDRGLGARMDTVDAERPRARQGRAGLRDSQEPRPPLHNMGGVRPLSEPDVNRVRRASRYPQYASRRLSLEPPMVFKGGRRMPEMTGADFARILYGYGPGGRHIMDTVPAAGVDIGPPLADVAADQQVEEPQPAAGCLDRNMRCWAGSEPMTVLREDGMANTVGQGSAPTLWTHRITLRTDLVMADDFAERYHHFGLFDHDGQMGGQQAGEGDMDTDGNAADAP